MDELEEFGGDMPSAQAQFHVIYDMLTKLTKQQEKILESQRKLLAGSMHIIAAIDQHMTDPHAHDDLSKE